MNEREAVLLASRITTRWPDHIHAVVVGPAKCLDDQSYAVRLAIPRENRILRLGHVGQLEGILDICTTLVGSPTTHTLARTMKGKPMVEQQASIKLPEQELEIFTEEEAATYLGVKVVTIRAYASSDILTRQPDGGFLLADLRRYKEARDARGRAPKPATAPTASEESVTPVASLERDIYTSEEERIIQAVIAHAFATVPGIRSLGRLSEVPRTWKVDVMTERGPESYRVMRGIDGGLQQERW